MAGPIGFRRGDLVVAAAPGDYGKPRPNLVVQSNLFGDISSVTVCPLTSTLRADQPLLRLTIQPSGRNGLTTTSQILIDKITTFPVAKIGQKIGALAFDEILLVNQSLAVFLGLR